MSDLDLAQRLVEAAEKAARRAQLRRLSLRRLSRHLSVSHREWARLTARGSTVGVLRTLADSLPREPDTNATPEFAHELYALADSIEKGEPA
jgi:hypothetical protein